MTAVLIAVFVASLAGYLVRSHSAAVERRQWQAGQERWLAERERLQQSIAELCEHLSEALNEAWTVRDPYRDFQRAPWLVDALQALHGQILEGERPVNLTAELVDGDGSAVAVSINPGHAAERSILLDRMDGDQYWQEPHPAQVPDSPEGLTG